MRISSFFIPGRVARDFLRAEGGNRAHVGLLLAVATGVGVGGLVLLVDKAALDWLAEPISHQPLWLRAAAPGVGLVVAWGALTFIAARASPATTEEYIRGFHDPAGMVEDTPEAVGRTVASVGTIGYGGALGMDGPALYLGGVVGTAVQRRLGRFFARDDAKFLLVAGAAAGVSAVFKTPAAGALFAMEVPFRSGMARRVALPALIGAASSYVTVALIDGTTPLLPLPAGDGFDRWDLLGVCGVGLLCGAGARGFCLLLEELRARVGELPVALRIAAAGVVLFGLAFAAEAAVDEPLSLGTGYDVILWVADPARSLWLVLALLVLRTLATLATVGGGGVGGLLVPLLVAGALLGRLGGSVPGLTDSDLWIVVGMAALAGAGCRTPFAAVAFVAEATGQAGYLVPAVLATATAQLVMGPASVWPGQWAGRLSRLERRGHAPLSMVLETDVPTVPPDATIEELLTQHLVGRRQRRVVVVDGDRYLGFAVLDDVRRIRPSARAEMVVGARFRAVPAAPIAWMVRDALQVMEAADTDVLAVVDGDDRFVGIVTVDGIRRLDEVLEADVDAG